MANETPRTLLQSITLMIDNIANEGSGYDTLVNILSLLCILHILNRTQPLTVTPATQNSPVTGTNTGNPLQKLLGELTKGGGEGGGPSPDMLATLLPLLNNPQIKSKLNPANISSMLSVLGNLGGGGSGSSSGEKQEGSSKGEKAERKDSPAAAVTPSLADSSIHTTSSVPDEAEKKDLGRSLNWKTTFESEKEV